MSGVQHGFDLRAGMGVSAPVRCQSHERRAVQLSLHYYLLCGMTRSMQTVEVFSQKGGVGKTTLSVLLAREFVKQKKLSALIIDADLSGTCLGDGLIDLQWSTAPGLADLICDPPENLPEVLKNPPVYCLDRAGKTTDEVRLGSDGPGKKSQIWFCPSHLYVQRAKYADVLRALAAHESSGNWVRYVIDALINSVASHLRRLETPGLGAVIIDHSPGLAALQQSSLDRIRQSAIKAAQVLKAAQVVKDDEVVNPGSSHCGILIMNRDKADVKMCTLFSDIEANTLDVHVNGSDLGVERSHYLTFVVNRTDTQIKSLEPHFSIPNDGTVGTATEKGQLGRFKIPSNVASAITEIANVVFR